MVQLKRRFNKPVFDRANLEIPVASLDAALAANSLLAGGTGAGMLNLRGGGLSRCRLRGAASLSIADGVATQVKWDTTVVDTDRYNPTLGNSLQIPFTGQYLIISNARFAVDTTGQRQLYCEHSVDFGVSYAILPNLVDNRDAPNVLPGTCMVSGIQTFTQLDRIRMRAMQSSGGALNLTDADIQLVYMGEA